MKSVQGWRYIVGIPEGFNVLIRVSECLYGSQGEAIDAMLSEYPDTDYPDIERHTIQDDEIR